MGRPTMYCTVQLGRVAEGREQKGQYMGSGQALGLVVRIITEVIQLEMLGLGIQVVLFTVNNTQSIKSVLGEIKL